MPLKGIPGSIPPELLFALAKMGHGDAIVIADANFPSDTVAQECLIKTPIRVHGSTASILSDILQLLPIDTYATNPVIVMDRVPCDKQRGLHVPAYELLSEVSKVGLHYMERFDFYDAAKKSFCVIQTDDRALYANVIVYKGVL